MSQSIDSTGLLLNDRWPGIANNNAAGPYDLGNVANGSDQNWYVASTKPPHVLGTKFTGYQEAASGVNGGSFTLIYLNTGTLLSTTAITAKKFCALQAAPTSSTSGALLYTVTNNPAYTVGMSTALYGVSMSAMTSGGYYGWFWCGGVCPESICTGMAGTYTTADTVTVGGFILATDTIINPAPDPANNNVQLAGQALVASA
jgi:hypothetical protein